MSDETTDLTTLLYRHRTLANGPSDCVCACDGTWRSTAEYRAHLAEQIAAAGFGPVRAVEAERELAHYADVAEKRYDEAKAATARAESAEAALAGLREAVEDLASQWDRDDERDMTAGWASDRLRALLPTPDREEARDE